MKYSIEWLLKSLNQGKTFKYLFFWGHRPSNDGSITKSCFSQWWESKFEYNGEVFKTAEQWMMAEKAKLFGDNDLYNKILKSSSPGEAKKLGREIINFNQKVWDDNKRQIVIKGNLLKFSQNVELRKYLIGTNKRILVEASPVDQIWGNGLSFDSKDALIPQNWRGQNLLGFVLMEVRDLLIKSL